MNLSGQAEKVRFWRQMEQLHALRKRRAQTALRLAQDQVRDLQQRIAHTHDDIAGCRQMLQQAHARFVNNMLDMTLRSRGHLDQVAAINRDRQTLSSSIGPLEEQLTQARHDVDRARQKIHIADQRSDHASDALRASRRKLQDLREEQEA